jgi:hypothetical protein
MLCCICLCLCVCYVEVLKQNLNELSLFNTLVSIISIKEVNCSFIIKPGNKLYTHVYALYNQIILTGINALPLVLGLADPFFLAAAAAGQVSQVHLIAGSLVGEISSARSVSVTWHYIYLLSL